MKKLAPIILLFFSIFLSSNPVNGMGIFSELLSSLRRSVTSRLYHTARGSESFSWNKGYVPTKQAQERTPIGFDTRGITQLYFDTYRRLAYFYKPEVKNLLPSLPTPKKLSQENN